MEGYATFVRVQDTFNSTMKQFLGSTAGVRYSQDILFVEDDFEKGIFAARSSFMWKSTRDTQQQVHTSLSLLVGHRSFLYALCEHQCSVTSSELQPLELKCFNLMYCDPILCRKALITALQAIKICCILLLFSLYPGTLAQLLLLLFHSYFVSFGADSSNGLSS